MRAAGGSAEVEEGIGKGEAGRTIEDNRAVGTTGTSLRKKGSRGKPSTEGRDIHKNTKTLCS